MSPLDPFGQFQETCGRLNLTNNNVDFTSTHTHGILSMQTAMFNLEDWIGQIHIFNVGRLTKANVFNQNNQRKNNIPQIYKICWMHDLTHTISGSGTVSQQESAWWQNVSRTFMKKLADTSGCLSEYFQIGLFNRHHARKWLILT